MRTEQLEGACFVAHVQLMHWTRQYLCLKALALMFWAIQPAQHPHCRPARSARSSESWSTAGMLEAERCRVPWECTSSCLELTSPADCCHVLTATQHCRLHMPVQGCSKVRQHPLTQGPHKVPPPLQKQKQQNWGCVHVPYLPDAMRPAKTVGTRELHSCAGIARSAWRSSSRPCLMLSRAASV